MKNLLVISLIAAIALTALPVFSEDVDDMEEWGNYDYTVDAEPAHYEAVDFQIQYEWGEDLGDMVLELYRGDEEVERWEVDEAEDKVMTIDDVYTFAEDGEYTLEVQLNRGDNVYSEQEVSFTVDAREAPEINYDDMQTLSVGDTLELDVTADYELSYESKHTGILEVDEDGIVKAVDSGVTRVIAYDEVSGLEDSVTIVVPMELSEDLTVPYEIQEGETLSGLADRAGITLEELIEINPDIEDIDSLEVGQEVQVPAFCEIETPTEDTDEVVDDNGDGDEDAVDGSGDEVVDEDEESNLIYWIMGLLAAIVVSGVVGLKKRK